MKHIRVAAILLLGLCSACDDPTTPPLLRATVGGLFTDAEALQVGEVLTRSAAEAQAVFLAGGESGSEYLYVPFNAAERGTARMSVEVTGGQVTAPTPPPSPVRIPSGASRSVEIAAERRPDEAFHLRLRQRERDELRSLVRSTPAPSASLSTSALVDVTPTLGEIVEINANPNSACSEPDLREGRVVAISDRAIVVEDVANPAGGFSPQEFQDVANTFDDLIYDVSVTNFGEPRFASFITPQDRIILFYTVAVNELTPPGSTSFTGGFFFARDLFPQVTTGNLEGCSASNEAPIMYLLSPDPAGETGNVRTREFVLAATLGTVAHEFQHLINQARRLFVSPGADPFEEVWLNEGLSHLAEELIFYAASGLAPRLNIDLDAIRKSEQRRLAFNTYQSSNFGRFMTYLREPEENSLLGIDELPTRGASWAFLRYAADHEPGRDSDFFRSLVDGPATGVENLRAALPAGFDPVDLMQTWTVSVYLDDALPGVAFPAIYQQPSWDFRDLYEELLGEYPLDVVSLTERSRDLSLQGGGAAFLRFGVAAADRATLVTTSGGAVPPERLRISVVRLR